MLRILLKDSLLDFGLSYRKYLLFELIYSFLSSILFVPFLSYVFNWMLTMIGKNGVLLNYDIFTFGFSFKGVMVLAIILLLAAAVLFVEFGVVIIISHKSYFRQELSIAGSVLTTLSNLPKLIGLGVIQIVFLLLLVVPFLDGTTLPPLLDINVTILLTDFWQESFAAKLFYVAIFLLGVWLFVRWIFSLHFIFIEDRSIWSSMKASWIMTRRRTFKLVLSIFALNALLGVAGFTIVSLISRIAGVIDSKWFGDIFGSYLITLSGYGTIVLTLFIIPLNMIMLTRLFYQALPSMGIPVRDRLILKDARILGRSEKRLERFLNRHRAVVLVSVAVVLTAMFAINQVINESVVYLPWDVEVAGHRGDGFDSPENSISGIKSSITKGVDAVEIDVTLTKDNVLVLSHDQNLKRTAGIDRKIRDLTYEELEDVDIGRLFDEAYAGEHIPTLDEVLELASDRDTRVIIDVKTDENEDIYAKEIVRLVEKNDAGDISLVQSFNPDILRMVRRQNETIEIGQILFLSAGNLSGMDVDFYTVRESMLTERFIRQAKENNREIWVWTVNLERNMREVLEYDIDGIITDYPEKLRRLLGVQMAKEEK